MVTPVPGDGLEDGERGERGGVGAQDAGTEADRASKGKFRQAVKLRFGEAALGTDQHRRAVGQPVAQPADDLGDRRRPAALVADDEAAPRRPAREPLRAIPA